MKTSAGQSRQIVRNEGRADFLTEERLRKMRIIIVLSRLSRLYINNLFKDYSERALLINQNQ